MEDSDGVGREGGIYMRMAQIVMSNKLTRIDLNLFL